MNTMNRNKSFIKSIKWLFLACLILSVTACSTNNDREYWGLNDNVKSCFERYYKVEKKFGKWENGNLEYHGHYQVSFDKKGQYQEIDYYDYDMNLSGKIIPVRKNNKIIEEQYYDEGGTLRSITKINQISNRESQYESFNEDGEKVAFGKSIRKAGKLMEQNQTIVRDDSENEIYTTTHEYDKDGNVISFKRISSESEVDLHVRYEYLEFDEKKNWTKRLMYVDDDEPQNIAVREIEYY